MSLINRRALAKQRIMAGEGFIYAAWFSGHRSDEHTGEESGPVIKIGFSLTPLKRVFVELSRQNGWLDPEVLGYVPGSIRDEKKLHEALLGRPRRNRRAPADDGDAEYYPPSILDHPALPAGIVFKRPAPKTRARTVP